MKNLVKETDLPGIGKKFAVTPITGGEIILIVHDNGLREIYRYDADDNAKHIITLNDSEARKIAGILGGMAYTPKALENMELSLSDLTIEWHKPEPNAPIYGKTIGDLGVRKNTGVNIIAIIGQDGRSTVNPGPDSSMNPGDTIVLAGTREQIKAFKTFVSAPPTP
ncbi:MAG: cation:proton antiporter regulatory subunit [Peptococcaceae bacterium]|jgi:TrkA domain protein|nr:cation:proton antiporter regulatory subunit [Peptococcaceae bacterium]